MADRLWTGEIEYDRDRMTNHLYRISTTTTETALAINNYKAASRVKLNRLNVHTIATRMHTANTPRKLLKGKGILIHSPANFLQNSGGMPLRSNQVVRSSVVIDSKFMIENEDGK